MQKWGGRKSGAVLTGYLGLSFASNKRHCQNVRQPRLRHPATLSGSNCLPPHRGRARHNFIFRIKVSQLMCQIHFDPVTGLWCYFRHFRGKKWGLFWLKLSDWVQKHLICLHVFEQGGKSVYESCNADSVLGHRCRTRLELHSWLFWTPFWTEHVTVVYLPCVGSKAPHPPELWPGFTFHLYTLVTASCWRNYFRGWLYTSYSLPVTVCSN